MGTERAWLAAAGGSSRPPSRRPQSLSRIMIPNNHIKSAYNSCYYQQQCTILILSVSNSRIVYLLPSGTSRHGRSTGGSGQIDSLVDGANRLMHGHYTMHEIENGGGPYHWKREEGRAWSWDERRLEGTNEGLTTKAWSSVLG